MLIFGYCSKELRDIEISDPAVELEAEAKEFFSDVMNFEAILDALRNHVGVFIPDHLWELYQMVDFKEMLFHLLNLKYSSESLIKKFSSQEYKEIYFMNRFLDNILSEKLKKKVIFDLFLKDTKQTSGLYGFLSNKMFDILKRDIKDTWHLDCLKTILMGCICRDSRRNDHLGLIRDFEETIDLDKPDFVLKLSLISKSFVKKNHDKRIALSKQKDFEGKVFSSYPIMEKKNGKEDTLIGLDRNMRVIFDRRFKREGGRRAYFNCLRASGRKVFKFQNLKNNTSEKDLCVIDVFPLMVLKNFKNIRQGQIKPVFLFYYDRESDDNKLTVFQGRSKKILRKALVKDSSSDKSYKVERGVGKCLYDGSKLIFFLNEFYFFDFLAPGSGLNFHKISLQNQYIKEKEASNLSLGAPYATIWAKKIDGIRFYSLSQQTKEAKRVLKSKLKYSFWNVLPFDWFSMIFVWKNEQMIRLYISNDSLKNRDLVIDLDIQKADEEGQISPFLEVDLLYEKLIIFFKDGVEWELSYKDLEREITNLIEEENLIVYEQRKVVLDPREELIREYQEKILKIEQKIKELNSEVHAQKETRLSKDN